jgi:hypothetical protein
MPSLFEEVQEEEPIKEAHHRVLQKIREKEIIGRTEDSRSKS